MYTYKYLYIYVYIYIYQSRSKKQKKSDSIRMRCDALRCEAACAREEERFGWLGFAVGVPWPCRVCPWASLHRIIRRYG